MNGGVGLDVRWSKKVGRSTQNKNPEPQIYLEGPEIAKTAFFFSIRACPRAAIANSRGLLLG